MRPSAFCHIAFAVLLVPGSADALRQAGGGASQAPQFFEETATTPARVDPRRDPALSKLIALHLRGVTLDSAIRAIGAKSGLRFVYDPGLLPATAPITIDSDSIGVGEALTRALSGTDLDVQLTAVGLTSLVPRKAKPAAHGQESATITGHVTDSATGRGLARATVFIENTRWGATANDSGAYRIESVPTGTYTVLARMLGYVAARKSVTVTGDQVNTVDLALEKSPSQLDQVVVTGTIVPTEVKALPTPVSVITTSDIEEQHPLALSEVIRQVVPSAVAWDFPTNPTETSWSVRGASTLTPGIGSLKVYLDGIELADRSSAAIDPNSIDRIEVIRGPEAATIYGSGAIGGVVQIFTKHGDSTATRPHADVSAVGGVIQSPYPGYSGAARQRYAATMWGGTPSASYNFGAGYEHNGNWVPEGQVSVPSGYGMVRLSQGDFDLDLLARYYEQKSPNGLDPRLAQTGNSYWSKPFYQQYDDVEETYGLHLAYNPVPWWHSNLTVGRDRLSIDAHQTQARFTTPADSELLVVESLEPKTSVAFNSSAQVMPAPGLSAIFTGGVDAYRLLNSESFTFGALNTTGTLVTDPSQPVQASRNIATNVGYFGQVQVNVRDALFLTTAVRAEQNSGIGSNLGTLVSPRFGLSWVRPLGGTTLKMRGSYGEAIRPPDPGLATAYEQPGYTQLANASLGPERQRGWDAGVDLVAGSITSFGMTYYNQTASGLITQVPINPGNSIYQYQNLARVRNSGVEIEATLAPVRSVELRAQYAYAGSIVGALGSSYTGDLVVGEQVFLVPWNTAGLSLRVMQGSRMSVTAGMTYVGNWVYYNWFAENACFGGTGPCAATTRGYLTHYPAFAKVNVAVERRLASTLSLFVAANNLANTYVHEFQNTEPVMGRLSTVGVRLDY